MRFMGMSSSGIAELLEIQKGVTALIGSGGKTTLLYQLAGELSRWGSVVLTTTTHIRVPEQFPLAQTAEEAQKLLKEGKTVCIGTPCDGGKLTAPGFLGWEKLADFVLVEADGARMHPLKAHASYEPVIPAGSTHTICVVGASGFGQPVGYAAHRPELYAALLGAKEQTKVTPAMAGQAVEKEHLANRVFLNQTDVLPRIIGTWQIKEFAAELSVPVVAGSLRLGIWERAKK